MAIAHLVNVKIPRWRTPVLSPLPLEVLPAPHSNGLDERTHGFPVARDAVPNSRRDFRMNGATDEPLVLEIVPLSAGTVSAAGAPTHRPFLPQDEFP